MYSYLPPHSSFPSSMFLPFLFPLPLFPFFNFFSSLRLRIPSTFLLSLPPAPSSLSSVSTSFVGSTLLYLQPPLQPLPLLLFHFLFLFTPTSSVAIVLFTPPSSASNLLRSLFLSSSSFFFSSPPSHYPPDMLKETKSY